MEEKSLSPFVYWAQSEKEVTLKIDLRSVKVRYFLFSYPQIDLRGIKVRYLYIY